MDSPPTSLVEPSTENFSKVIFNKVEKKYKTGADINCSFTYTEPFQPREKDWVGIFKVGWKITRDYFTYVFVKSNNESAEGSIIFKAYYLPKVSEEFYQFCYVDENGEVRGASIPFQICQEMEMEEDDDMLIVMPEDTMEKFNAEVSALKDENASQQKTIDELQTKNEQLENEIKKLSIQLESERNRITTDNQTLEKEIKKQFNDKLMQLQTDLKNTEQLLKKSQMETVHEKEENDAQAKEVAKLRVEMTLQEVAITDLKEKLQRQSETVKTLEMEKENLQLAVEEQLSKTLQIQEEMKEQLTSTKEQLCKTENDLHQEKRQSETVKTLVIEKENLQLAVEEKFSKTLQIQEEMKEQLTSTKEQLCKTENDLHQEKIAKTTQQNVIEKLNATIAKQDAEITELRRQNQIAGLAHQNEAEKLQATNAEHEVNITVLRGQIQVRFTHLHHVIFLKWSYRI
uniref:SKICH domain-containing protein n=1 Tax=Leptobrachium leishanense TaxID=445787 RepID=A0A8C5QHF7_9ANUR